MKLNSKLLTSSALSVAMIFSSVMPVYAKNYKQDLVNYVALGDSCAAGVRAVSDAPGFPYRDLLPGWEEESNYGYTDLIAKWLKNNFNNENKFGIFDESLSISGLTAAQLNSALADQTSLLSNGDIFTITVGANDLLGPLYEFFDLYSAGLIPEEQVISAATAAALNISINLDSNLTLLSYNYSGILSQILSQNPNAKIYVMGYYDPIPALPYMFDTDFDLTPLVDTLNLLIYNLSLTSNAVTYVDTYQTINGDYDMYAYNPDYDWTTTDDAYLYVDISSLMADIHLTEAGYAAVANQFEYSISTIQPDLFD